jgi:drug/metabolite transporter (DMT)-like permease
VAAAAIGVWLLAAGVPGGLHASRADQAGIAFALVSAVLYSFYLLGSARLVRATGPRAATAWGLGIGSLPMLAWSPPWTVHASGDPAAVAGLIAFMVVAATAIAFSLSQASLRRITPTEFAVTSTLEPALAAVAAATGRRCAVMLPWTSTPTHAGCGRAGRTPTSAGSRG